MMANHEGGDKVTINKTITEFYNKYSTIQQLNTISTIDDYKKSLIYAIIQDTNTCINKSVDVFILPYIYIVDKLINDNNLLYTYYNTYTSKDIKFNTFPTVLNLI